MKFKARQGAHIGDLSHFADALKTDYSSRRDLRRAQFMFNPVQATSQATSSEVTGYRLVTKA
jgi:uncharacterized protein YggE